MNVQIYPNNNMQKASIIPNDHIILKQEQAIHDRYRALFSFLNLPDDLIEELCFSQRDYRAYVRRHTANKLNTYPYFIKKRRKSKRKTKLNISFSRCKKLNNKVYKRKIHYLEAKQFKFQPKWWVKQQKKPKKVFKPKRTLPWIVEGRKTHRQLKKVLVSFKKQLQKASLILKKRLKVRKKSHRRLLHPLLTREDRKIIKKFRKHRKYGRFARYGRRSFKFLAKIRKYAHINNKNKGLHEKSIIKRQNLYTQHRRLACINTVNTANRKYMYMLVIIWYLLFNVFTPLYKHILNYEIWFSYFVKNMWAHQSPVQINNLYLNYGINTGLNAKITHVNIYIPSRNALNNELQAFKIHQRLMLASKRPILKKSSRKSFRRKRKTKVRTFFRISPRLKRKHIFNNKFGKNKKNKYSRRLEDKEWLFVSKFTRKKYQHQFPTLFSNWKNIKKIKKYINKQSHIWHQPYIITHPYYYTTRYKTFVYSLANK